MLEIKVRLFHPLSLWIITGMVSIFLFILLYSYNFKPLVADYYYFEVKKAEARGDCRGILDNMEKTLEWYPVSHYYARAYLYHGANCFLAVSDKSSQNQLANNLLEQAATISKRDWQFLTILDLAHMYSILGIYVNDQYYTEGEKLYKELLERGPNITTIYQDYGRMKLTQNKNNEAIELFRKGIEISQLEENVPFSEHVQSIYQQVAFFNDLIGDALVKEKKYDEALEPLKKAISLDPLAGSYYKDIADIYYKKENINQAIYYNELGYKYSSRTEPWPYLLATLYFEKGDIHTAKKYAEQARLDDPNNSKIKDLVDKIEERK